MRERDAEDLSPARPGERIDLEERRIEDVKQMKSSLAVGVFVVLWGLSMSIIDEIFWAFFIYIYFLLLCFVLGG